MKQYHYLFKYDEAATINFALADPNGFDIKPDASPVAADLKIMKDEAAEVATTNLPTDEGQTYTLVLTAAEMSFKRIVVIINDVTGPDAWEPVVLVIWTFGHASAQFPTKLVFAV